MVMVSNVSAIEDARRPEEIIGAFVQISNNDDRDFVDEVADRGKRELIVDSEKEARSEEGCGLAGVFDG